MTTVTQFPRFDRRPSAILDGLWDFAFLGTDVNLRSEYQDLVPDRFAERAPVPGCFDTLPQYAGVRGTACYRTLISIVPRATGLLRFGGNGLWVRVYLDGDSVFEGSEPYSPIDVELPAADHSERELVVLVDNRFDPERVPLFEPFFDFYAYGGIFRSVELQEVPHRYIRRLEVTPLDVEHGKVRLNLYTSLPEPGSLSATLSFDGGDAHQVTLEPGADCHIAEINVPEPRPWSPADPQLHRVRLDLGDDSIEVRFGLRTVEACDGRILLNGETVTLLGVCRHEAHPQFGPALPLDQLVQDLALIRSMGCNFVRGVHYAQDQRFLDLCDELGLLVFEESLGWGQREKRFFENPAFKRGQLSQTRRMIGRSFNHPSVILWGFLNEGASNQEYARDVYTELIALIKTADPSRLVTYASMFPFDDLFLDQVDVISVNQYPGWYSGEGSRPLGAISERLDAITAHLAVSGLADKPVIVSEIGAGAIYGWRDSHRARWSEEYQRDHLEIVCNEIIGRAQYAGVALWQFCDCRTYDDANAIKRPRGFNNKGLFDEYRRPKLAVEAVTTVFSGASRR